MKSLVILIILILISCTVYGGDLYEIEINSQTDADILKQFHDDVILPTSSGYLFLLEKEQLEILYRNRIGVTLVALNIEHSRLSLSSTDEKIDTSSFEILYTESKLLLLADNRKDTTLKSLTTKVYTPLSKYIEIKYKMPVELSISSFSLFDSTAIENIINQVNRDTLQAYTEKLQSFDGRLSGTESNFEASGWLLDKLLEYGYIDAHLDPFIGAQLWSREPCQSYNVIAQKTGARFPDHKIVITAHFDAVPGSPGADDNGSGTAALLECARIFSTIPNDITIVFLFFDSEESGLKGAYHYLDSVKARNDDQIVMINMDMIAHHENSDTFNIVTNRDGGYGLLMAQLAETFIGMSVDLGGMSASDHLPFEMAGYNVVPIVEKIRSTEYHEPSDSCVYLNFDYMTKITKSCAATIATIDSYPPPIRFLRIEEPGDGQTRIAYWKPLDSESISFQRMTYYRTSDPNDLTQVDLGAKDSIYVFANLVEGAEYIAELRAFNDFGQTSIGCDKVSFIPDSRPAPPTNIRSLPLKEAVLLNWNFENDETDFSHCAVVRDSVIIAETLDSFYIDSDLSIDNDLHHYQVITVDTSGRICDTSALEVTFGKAARLEQGKILAINRTQIHDVDFVDESLTGSFLEEALAGYDFDYRSDTAITSCNDNCNFLELNNLIDYELVVIGAESGHNEDIAFSPILNGILDSLAYYLSIGGKALIFGRWGTLGQQVNFDYLQNLIDYDDAYSNCFHIKNRTCTMTSWTYGTPAISGDLIKANRTVNAYPNLIWDSLLTISHSSAQQFPITSVDAIPCASYVDLDTSIVDIIYTYQSKNLNSNYNSKPVAWRYFGDDYNYIYFELPLSFFYRPAGNMALQHAVDELLAGKPIDSDEPVEPPEDDNLPNHFRLAQNYPNPFNAGTIIEYEIDRIAQVNLDIFNILGQKVVTLVNETQTANRYQIQWDGKNDQGQQLASGIYLYRLQTDYKNRSKKMLLLK